MNRKSPASMKMVARHSDYAKKQSDEMLNVRHDRSHFEHDFR